MTEKFCTYTDRLGHVCGKPLNRRSTSGRCQNHPLPRTIHPNSAAWRQTGMAEPKIIAPYRELGSS